MIKYKRNLPKGGASSLVLALGTFGFCAFGFYKLIMGNRQRRSVDSDAPVPVLAGPTHLRRCTTGCGIGRRTTTGSQFCPSSPLSAT